MSGGSPGNVKRGTRFVAPSSWSHMRPCPPGKPAPQALKHPEVVDIWGFYLPIFWPKHLHFPMGLPLLVCKVPVGLIVKPWLQARVLQSEYPRPPGWFRNST